jgi:hypothetical protein
MYELVNFTQTDVRRLMAQLESIAATLVSVDNNADDAVSRTIQNRHQLEALSGRIDDMCVRFVSIENALLEVGSRVEATYKLLAASIPPNPETWYGRACNSCFSCDHLAPREVPLTPTNTLVDTIMHDE